MRPDLRLPMVATKDIAAKAAELLGSAAFDNHARHYLLGPRDHSMQDAASIIGPAIGRPELAYVQFSYEQARQGLLQAGMSAGNVDLMEDMIRNSNEGKTVAHAGQHHAHYPGRVCPNGLRIRFPTCAGTACPYCRSELCQYYLTTPAANNFRGDNGGYRRPPKASPTLLAL